MNKTAGIGDAAALAEVRDVLRPRVQNGRATTITQSGARVVDGAIVFDETVEEVWVTACEHEAGTWAAPWMGPVCAYCGTPYTREASHLVPPA